MAFRIRGLDPARFAHLAGLDAGGLARHRAERHVADAKPGFPCRVTLEDAEPGERVLLVNYEHLPVDTPYRASHAIYVREAAVAAWDAHDALPPALAARLLSIRAFDARGSMHDADLADGREAPALIQRLFANPGVAYLHAHFARRGCFAARIDRD